MPEPHTPSRPQHRPSATLHALPPRAPTPPVAADDASDYAELHCLSHFSFQRGASSPEDLVRRAWTLGYTALALTDECSVAGVVRAWNALRECLRQPPTPRAEPLKLLYGSEFRFANQGTLVALAPDLDGWGQLCQFITLTRRAAPKGDYRLPPLPQALAALHGCVLLWAPDRAAQSTPDLIAVLAVLATASAQKSSRMPPPALLAELHGGADDALWLAQLRQASAATGWPLLAAGDVQLHARGAKRLHDVLCAIRLGRPVADCGFALQANAERHLRPRPQLAHIHPPALLVGTLAVAARCGFRLEELRYNYPQETVLPGLTPTQTLRRLTLQGAAERYPRGTPPPIAAFIDKELALIAECRYEMFFLTVHDIVREARRRGILCQGRGSAANSVVCWCLGITAADPEKSHPLLERFISRARRHEPPDIDVDFEHERREEVIQYIHAKYGRERAALAATVICWRTRSALRDVGQALGVPQPLIDAFAKEHHRFHPGEQAALRLHALAEQLGTPIGAEQARLWLHLAGQLRGTPRHLSQHVGGFVLTQTALTRLVPVEPAAMPGTGAWDEAPDPADASPLADWLPARPALRQVIQWDKDDLEALGMLKVDVLALGMLSALRRCIEMVAIRRGHSFTRYDIQSEDAATYAMIRRADTVGTFQIESRAQMSMLPRLKPTTFYDLVVQVAIVRPGPISGGMVHPYLQARERARRGLPITYERSTLDRPDAPPRLAQALGRTLGIPIFQEQVMELSMLAAGFSADDADSLRRAMAAWKRKGGLEPFEQRLTEGMRAHGYSADFARRIFEQIKGFGEYGFPESHAYSFALIAYESAWLKCHEPEAFLAALLNSQPMGFYGPSQLIQDAQRHGVAVRPPDATVSHWDCALEPLSSSGSDHHFSAQRPAVRLGLRLIKGLNPAAAQRIAQARAQAPFADVADLARRAALTLRETNLLAAADALGALAGHRRQQVWQAAAQQAAPALLQDAPIDEAALPLAAAGEGEEIVHDYAALTFSLRRHPLALLRARLARRGLQSAAQLDQRPHGAQVRACGLVTVRQQPGTAKGTIFVTLEDETGPVNVIVWQSLHAQPAQRQALLNARLLAVHGRWQRDPASDGHTRHLIAEGLRDFTSLLGALRAQVESRDFH